MPCKVRVVDTRIHEIIVDCDDEVQAEDLIASYAIDDILSGDASDYRILSVSADVGSSYDATATLIEP